MANLQTTKKAKADLQAELQKETSKLKRNVCPGYDAQEIRARLSTSFDSPDPKMDGFRTMLQNMCGT